MNIKKLYKLHNLLLRELGDDLVVSLVVDEGKKLLSVSTHKAKLLSYKTGRHIQTCELSNYDLTHDIDAVGKELVEIYSNLLYTDPEKVKTQEKKNETM